MAGLSAKSCKAMGKGGDVKMLMNFGFCQIIFKLSISSRNNLRQIVVKKKLPDKMSGTYLVTNVDNRYQFCLNSGRQK